MTLRLNIRGKDLKHIQAEVKHITEGKETTEHRDVTLIPLKKDTSDFYIDVLGYNNLVDSPQGKWAAWDGTYERDIFIEDDKRTARFFKLVYDYIEMSMKYIDYIIKTQQLDPDTSAILPYLNTKENRALLKVEGEETAYFCMNFEKRGFYQLAELVYNNDSFEDMKYMYIDFYMTSDEKSSARKVFDKTQKDKREILIQLRELIEAGNNYIHALNILKEKGVEFTKEGETYYRIENNPVIMQKMAYYGYGPGFFEKRGRYKESNSFNIYIKEMESVFIDQLNDIKSTEKEWQDIKKHSIEYFKKYQTTSQLIIQYKNKLEQDPIFNYKKWQDLPLVVIIPKEDKKMLSLIDAAIQYIIYQSYIKMGKNIDMTNIMLPIEEIKTYSDSINVHKTETDINILKPPKKEKKQVLKKRRIRPKKEKEIPQPPPPPAAQIEITPPSTPVIRVFREFGEEEDDDEEETEAPKVIESYNPPPVIQEAKREQYWEERIILDLYPREIQKRYGFPSEIDFRPLIKQQDNEDYYDDSYVMSNIPPFTEIAEVPVTIATQGEMDVDIKLLPNDWKNIKNEETIYKKPVENFMTWKKQFENAKNKFREAQQQNK